MTQKLKTLFIIVLSMLVGVVSTMLVRHVVNEEKQFGFKDFIPNEAVAIEVGKAICEEYFNDLDFSGYSWRALLYTDENNVEQWIVSCIVEKDHDTLDGGGPEVYIRKKDGKVLSISGDRSHSIPHS